MTKIYAHQYTITPWKQDKEGVQSVTMNIVTEDEDAQDIFKMERILREFFENDLNISHKIILEGYKND